MKTGKEIFEKYCVDSSIYMNKKKLIEAIDEALKEARMEGYQEAVEIENNVNK